MPIERKLVGSVEELLETLQKIEEAEQKIPIYILFKDKLISEKNKSENLREKHSLTLSEIKTILLDATDCIDVEAVIDDYLGFLPDKRSFLYITCELMPETYGPGTELCADHRFNIVKVPTMIRYKGPQRLETSELVSFPLLSIFFEEDEVEINQGDC